MDFTHVWYCSESVSQSVGEYKTYYYLNNRENGAAKDTGDEKRGI